MDDACGVVMAFAGLNVDFEMVAVRCLYNAPVPPALRTIHPDNPLIKSHDHSLNEHLSQAASKTFL